MALPPLSVINAVNEKAIRRRRMKEEELRKDLYEEISKEVISNMLDKYVLVPKDVKFHRASTEWISIRKHDYDRILKKE